MDVARYFSNTSKILSLKYNTDRLVNVLKFARLPQKTKLSCNKLIIAAFKSVFCSKLLYYYKTSIYNIMIKYQN